VLPPVFFFFFSFFVLWLNFPGCAKLGGVVCRSINVGRNKEGKVATFARIAAA